MNYDKVQEHFNVYVDKCKEIIKNTFFTHEDLGSLLPEEDLGIRGTIQKHRLHMIDIKLDHTMRMISQIMLINEQLGLKFDFKLVMQVAIMYHDIGRFSQATWSNTYNDKIYETRMPEFTHHGDEGAEIFKNHNFGVDKQYIPIISESILHHVKPTDEKAKHLQYKFNTDVSKININDIITGNVKLTEAECQVASLITQLVADIDKTDILYQQIGEDSDMIRDYVTDRSEETLDEIAKYWGVPKSDIIEYNQINEATYIPQPIDVPTKNMDVSKLEVPPYMKDMFYNNSYPPLKELQNDRHWHFITILWWRLSEFLNNINFYSVLVNIEESKLLTEMEKQVPEHLKPLTKEAFDYAREVLVKQTIKENGNSIYITKRGK